MSPHAKFLLGGKYYNHLLYQFWPPGRRRAVGIPKVAQIFSETQRRKKSPTHYCGKRAQARKNLPSLPPKARPRIFSFGFSFSFINSGTETKKSCSPRLPEILLTRLALR